MTHTLLSADEPPAYRVEKEFGRSKFFLICDHAGERIPAALGSLGVCDTDLQRHIAWDIGAANVSLALCALLDATLILQTYSRLVIDCNRPFSSPSSIVELSEHTPIPGNVGLDDADIERRQREIFEPYHARIRGLIAARAARGQATWLISMHSFTPVFMSDSRPWHAGILYNRDARLARALIRQLRTDGTLVVGDNEPYAVSDSTDYAVPEYGEKMGLPHVEIEIRQDLIADSPGQTAWAGRLSAALEAAALEVGPV